jgi:hypothetical protein
MKRIARISINVSIEPQEKYVFTFGTLQQYPTNCYVSPNNLFIQNGEEVYPNCNNLVKQDQTSNPSNVLRLRLDFSDVGCSVFPLGEVSYSKY